MGELGGVGGGSVDSCLAANDFLRRVVVRAIRTCISLTTTCARATQPFDDTFALRVACFNLILSEEVVKRSGHLYTTRFKKGGMGG